MCLERLLVTLLEESRPVLNRSCQEAARGGRKVNTSIYYGKEEVYRLTSSLGSVVYAVDETRLAARVQFIP